MVEPNAAALAVQQVILGVLRTLLKCDDISPTDNFLEVGGQSLHAVAVIDALRDRFALNVSPLLIFESATIAELAEHCVDEQEEFTV